MKRLFKSLLIGLAIVMAVSVQAQRSFDYDKIAPHPRLLMPAGGEDKIRELMSNDEDMAKIHDRIMSFCDKTLPTQPLKERALLTSSSANNMLGLSRSAQERIFCLAYAYRMTGETKYADRAVVEMEAMAAFKTWNPNHFLDVGEMAMALALGYDWLFDYLTPETKEKVREAILIKAFKTAEETNARFYRDINNWNSVCNAGFTCAALAIFDEAPKESIFVIEKCLKTNPLAMDCFGPDGGFPEGYNYWGYGATFQMLISASLESALGTDNGIAQAPGFMQSSRFIQFMTSPSKKTFSFSDTPEVGQCHFAMFWFAKKLNDPTLLWLERQYLSDENSKYAASRLLPLLLVFASEIDVDKITPPKEQHWFNRGATPVYIYRQGWEREDDTYLGVKGGWCQTSHAHADAGSFVFEKNGARWSMDLGAQDYGIQGKGVNLWGKGQDSDRWKIFRISSQAHSTLTVNNRPYLVNKRAEITETFQTKNKKGAVVDLTPLYSFALKKTERTIWLDKQDNLTVEDVIIGGDKEAEVMWVMCTPADAKIISDRKIELTIDDKKLFLTVESPATIDLQIWSNEPPREIENRNDGTQRVGFTTKVAANQDALLKVVLSDVE